MNYIESQLACHEFENGTGTWSAKHKKQTRVLYNTRWCMIYQQRLSYKARKKFTSHLIVQ